VSPLTISVTRCFYLSIHITQTHAKIISHLLNKALLNHNRTVISLLVALVVIATIVELTSLATDNKDLLIGIVKLF